MKSKSKSKSKTPDTCLTNSLPLHAHPPAAFARHNITVVAEHPPYQEPARHGTRFQVAGVFHPGGS